MSAYDLLRQTAALEVHDQGQGPGFASAASVRGFSSDHSTDLALRGRGAGERAGERLRGGVRRLEASPLDEQGVVLPAFALLRLSGGVRVWRGAELEPGIRNALDCAYPELRASGYVSPGLPRTVEATLRVTP